MFLTAWRSWRRAKGVALLAAVALAIGIGSATSIYTVVNAVMLKPLPYRDGDRFVALFGATFNDPEHYASLSYKDAQTFQERTRAFDAFGWFRDSGKNLIYGGEPYHVNGVAVTTPLVRALGVDPILGRWFENQDGVVLSSSLWRQLGSDRAIVGRRIRLDGRDYTVSGVMPESFRLPAAGIASPSLRVDVWLPLDPKEASTTGLAYFAYARRRPAVSFAEADADVKRVAAQIAAESPTDHVSYTSRLFDLRDSVIQDIRPTLLLVFAASGLLFVITCANAAGLLLARAVARSRETAVRVAIGASRSHLAAQYLVESLPLSLAGAAGGVALSLALTPAVVAMAGEYLPRSEEIAVDGRVLLFAVAAALLASAISSLAPLWQAAQTVPADVLADGGRTSAGARSRRLSQALVVGEVALAFALLAVSALLILHLRALSRQPAGFDPDRLVTFALSVPGAVASDPARRVLLQRRVIETLGAVPGVEAAALANNLPLDGCCMGTSVYPEGRPVDARLPQRTSLMAVSPGYFKAMRIPLQGGRLLRAGDLSDAIAFVVIDRAAATRYWGTDEAIGRYGRFGSQDGSRFQVVGLVNNVKNDGLGKPSVPTFYILSEALAVESMYVALRSGRPVASLMTDVRGAVREMDPAQPIHEITTMRDIVQRSVTLERAASVLTAFFAGAALLMATLGVYGVLSYSVRQRTVEIGTRTALGATRLGVLGLVVRSGLTMAAYGIAIGGAAGVGVAMYLGRVFDITALGPAPFFYATSMVAAVALTAAALPGWRASMLSPMAAMREAPESIWRSARVTVERAVRALAPGDRPAVSLGAVLDDLAGAIRAATSFPHAAGAALATFAERAGAQSIALLEPAADATFRNHACALPANGVLLNRLRRYPHPLPLTTGDFETWARWAAETKPEHAAEIAALAATGTRMAVPLRTKDEIVGVLLLGAPAGRETYTTSDKEVFGQSAGVFALMMENAKLTERTLEQEKVRRDLALAAEVQKRLLPPEAPTHAAVTVAAFSVPARTVGGDYYDFLALPNRRLGIAVADVSGKGVAAGLLMSVVQASLRVIAGEAQLSLAELCVRMNRFLYQSTMPSKYATFFYARLDGDGRRLRYVNAGHNPPYLIRRSGTGTGLTELTVGGTVLGLFPEVTYEEAAVDLQPGDLLVAFTDGIPDALDVAGEEFGEQRLKEVLADAAGLGIDQIAARIQDAVQQWIGAAEQADDLTLVLMAVK